MTKIILFSLFIFFLSSCNNDQSAPNIKDDYTIHFDTLSRLNDGVCLVNIQCWKGNELVSNRTVKMDCPDYLTP